MDANMRKFIKFSLIGLGIVAMLAATLVLWLIASHRRMDYQHSGYPRTVRMVGYLGDKIRVYQQDNGVVPVALQELTEPGSKGLGPYSKAHDFKDAWGRPYYYRAREDRKGFVLFSLGRDGRIGGEDQNADIGYQRSQAEDIER